MPGTVATKGGIAEANEHLRQLYARIDELETQLQAQIIYREQLTNLQNDNFEMKEMVHRYEQKISKPVHLELEYICMK